MVELQKCIGVARFTLSLQGSAYNNIFDDLVPLDWRYSAKREPRFSVFLTHFIFDLDHFNFFLASKRVCLSESLRSKSESSPNSPHQGYKGKHITGIPQRHRLTFIHSQSQVCIRILKERCSAMTAAEWLTVIRVSPLYFYYHHSHVAS